MKKMKTNSVNWRKAAIRWKQFSRKRYSVFQSLGREITIGALSVSTLTFALPCSSVAQTVLKAQKSLQQPTADEEVDLEELEVLGTRVPLSPEHSVRMVQVLTREQIAGSSAQSVNDLLKLVAGVDLRQRGACGIQTDIGVNGGTTDQLTVLLNGINISNPQTGHHTMLLPVSVDDIERIEVLEGGAGRLYGSSAFSGAINIVTRKERDEQKAIRLSGGSYGTVDAHAHLPFSSALVSNRLSGSYARSDGAVDNSDFNKGQAFLSGTYSSEETDVRWQAGMSTLNYGANTFYSPSYRNQYEENRSYLLSVSAHMKGRIHFLPSIYWNRHLDHYLLIRTNPQAYENFHQNNVYGVNLNSYFQWSLGKTAVGVEVRSEGVQSSSLGKPMEESEYVKVPSHDAQYTHSDHRTGVSCYLEHDVLWERVTLSLGLLANMNTALDYRYRLYPGVDLSWRPVNGWKLYASFNQGLRLPTFTDLYYKSPTINGNVGLKPEKSSDFHVGASYDSPALQARLKGFYRRGTDMIDWVKFTAEDTYHSTNYRLHAYGAEFTAQCRLGELLGDTRFLQTLTVGYAYIYQKREDDQPFYDSNYTSDYLRNKLTASLSHRILSRLEAQWDFRLQHRCGSFIRYEGGSSTGELTPYGTYGLLDLKLQWNAPRYTLFLQGNNLTGTHYYDLGNVEQPGFWFTAGVTVRL